MAAVRSGSPHAVYVWEAPVRLWHWVMMFAMIALAVTGYFIGSPLPSAPGEASEHFVMGYIRFVHFAAGYIFTIFFVLRLYWVFVGNKYAREIFLVPIKLFSPTWWRGLINQGLYYGFMRAEGGSFQGHNPLAMAAMFFMYVLGTVFMICTRALRSSSSS